MQQNNKTTIILPNTQNVRREINDNDDDDEKTNFFSDLLKVKHPEFPSQALFVVKNLE